MKYTKPSLTFEQQADLLMSRGLVASSRAEMVRKLRAVSYYRLSAYWYPFRRPDDSFKPGTTLEEVWRRYTFDRQLRLLVMDALERVEIAIRSRFVCHHTLRHGPFGYLDPSRLPKISPLDHQEVLRRVREEARRSRADFVRHYFAKYTSETHLPLWMACELMTFGNLLTLFAGAEKTLKQTVAAEYGISHEVLESWLRSLNVVRNLCAHHARLWNRELGLRPLIPRPRKHPEWHDPVEIPSGRVFGMLTILRYLLKQVAPHSRWKERLLALLDQYKSLPLSSAGFPPDWLSSPIWK